nr:MAG TPA: hypothetical protein [Caudoviricetes sp.]
MQYPILYKKVYFLCFFVVKTLDNKTFCSII